MQLCMVDFVLNIKYSDAALFPAVLAVLCQDVIRACVSGETVDMTHVVRGVDSDGALQVDVVVTGAVPYLPPGSPIILQPYTG